MTLADILIAELEREAAPTRKALERVPDDKLTWRPHEKSMTLGQLAQHIATIPGGIAQMSLADTFDMSNFSKPPELESAAALVPTWEKNVAKAKDILSELDDETMRKNWSLTKGGQTVIAVPRIGLFRTILLNHLYHHRGQLTVYLRLLNIPVPSIYGPSADENPFG